MSLYDATRQWEEFGRRDPYFGVASLDEFKRERLDEQALERFFQSGEDDVAGVVDRLPSDGFAPERVLDFGCGVGRTLVAFADRFPEVVGVDVSPAMLAEAERNCEARGLTNASLVETKDLATVEPVDMVHSSLVFQHVPVRDGERLFAQLVRLLRPGGVGVVQFTVAVRRRRDRAFYWTIKSVPFAYNVWNLTRRREWSYPHMQVNTYDLNRLAAILADGGCPEMRVRQLLDMEGRGGELAEVSFRRA